MDTDIILFIVSFVFLLIFLSSTIYMLYTQRLSQEYRNVQDEETKVFDAYTASAKLIPTGKSSLQAKALPTFRNALEKILEGKYVLESEIPGSGMSRVFVARSIKLGNQWLIKCIPKGDRDLIKEADILKRLNHPNLPRIVDILSDEKGTYLIETFIEGLPLSKVLESGRRINQPMLLDFAEQLCEVLCYLHELQPKPVYHLDLKPSNIMVTHGNKLVLIDFGISKMEGEVECSQNAATYRYAAPEQIKGELHESLKSLIEARFQNLPYERFMWELDARTDIYCLGSVLFELATDRAHTVNNMDLLKLYVSEDLAQIICKCLELYPHKRYGSARELLKEIQKLKERKSRVIHRLSLRKVAAWTLGCSLLFSTVAFGGAGYAFIIEQNSIYDVNPDAVTISLQQTTELQIRKLDSKGNVADIDPYSVRWISTGEGIAKIDGRWLAGLNIGTTTINGTRRGKAINVAVKVVEPLHDTVPVVQRFASARTASVLLGTTLREHIYGQRPELVSPESMALSEDGSIYFCDAGVLKRIQQSQVEPLSLGAPYLEAKIVRTFKDSLYVLTYEWEKDGSFYRSLLQEKDGRFETLLTDSAIFSSIEDFVVTKDYLYYIEYNIATDSTYLSQLTLEDGTILRHEIKQGAKAITADEKGNIYFSNTELGTISRFKNGKVFNLAGIEKEKAFVDGELPRFYSPTRLHWVQGAIYVWDFNVLRKLNLNNDIMLSAETIAGEVSTDFSQAQIGSSPAEDLIWPNSLLTDFIVEEHSFIVSDPKHSLLWAVRPSIPGIQ